MQTSGHIWRAAQDRLRQELTRAQYETWLRGTTLRLGDGGDATLIVRSAFARDHVERRFRERIEAAIAACVGHTCTLDIVIAQAEEPLPAARTSTAPKTRVATSAHTGALFAPAGAADQYQRPGLFDAPDIPSEQVADASARVIEPSQRVPVAVNRGDSEHAESDEEMDALRRVGARVALGRQPVAASRARAGRDSSDRGGRDSQIALVDGQAVMARQDDAQDERVHDTRRPARRFQEDATMSPRSYLPTHDSDEGAAPGANSLIPTPRLHTRYTFSTFIVGSGNQLAHAASQAVAEAPGHAYNPLFLYGGVGLGKTHLLHAIGHTALETDKSVLYVSSETFTNEIVNAIRYRTTEEFRAKYRSADVLLVDDIQFIAGKESTEEEFFHTFNTLYESNKQIVICSDRPPRAIISLEERLRSRFEWGLIADIQPPDLETRVAILRAKAEDSQRDVPDEVITFLASRVQSNIRELEGSLNRLLAFSKLQRQPLTIDTAKAALVNLATDARQRRVSIADVLQTVAEFYRIPLDVIRGKQRDKHIVVPRQVAMYLMRQETEASLLEIGQSLGGRDHSTVLHGCDKITREVNENTALRKEVLAIRQQLLG